MKYGSLILKCNKCGREVHPSLQKTENSGELALIFYTQFTTCWEPINGKNCRGDLEVKVLIP